MSQKKLRTKIQKFQSYIIGEVPVVVNRANKVGSSLDDAMGKTHAVVILTKGRCLVDDAGTTVGYIIEGIRVV